MKLLFVIFTMCILPIAKSQSRIMNHGSLNLEIKYIHNLLEDVHLDPYKRISKAKFLYLKNKLLKELTSPVTRIQYVKKIIPLIASLHDGHTAIEFPADERQLFFQSGGKHFPFTVEILEGKIYVLNNLSENEQIYPGCEITSINNTPAKKIIAFCRLYMSGEKNKFKDRMTAFYFSRMMWMYFDSTNLFTLSYTGSKYKKQNAIVNGINSEEFMSRLSASRKVSLPFSFEIKTINEKKIGYLDIKTFTEPEKYNLFIDSVFKVVLPKEKFEHLVIDVRENGGGYEQLVRVLLSYIIPKPVVVTEMAQYKIGNEIKKQAWFIEAYEKYKKFIVNNRFVFRAADDSSFLLWPKPEAERYKGKVYVFASHKSFSGAVYVPNIIKCYNLGTVIGEETGGLTSFYGSTYSMTLPYSKLSFGIALKEFILCCSKNKISGVKPNIKVKYSPFVNFENDLYWNRLTILLK